MASDKMKAKLLEIVDYQLHENNPTCTKENFTRLVEKGYTEMQAKEMIGTVLVKELSEVMKNQVEFNQQRYCTKLANLPE